MTNWTNQIIDKTKKEALGKYPDKWYDIFNVQSKLRIAYFNGVMDSDRMYWISVKTPPKNSNPVLISVIGLPEIKEAYYGKYEHGPDFAHLPDYEIETWRVVGIGYIRVDHHPITHWRPHPEFHHGLDGDNWYIHHLRSDRNEILRILNNIPQERVIDRGSMEHRLRQLDKLIQQTEMSMSKNENENN